MSKTIRTYWFPKILEISFVVLNCFFHLFSFSFYVQYFLYKLCFTRNKGKSVDLVILFRDTPQLDIIDRSTGPIDMGDCQGSAQ